MRSADDDQVTILTGAFRYPVQTSRVLYTHQAKRAEDLQLLYVLRQIPARKPLVDLLEAGDGTELVDSRFDIVLRLPLSHPNARQIDLRLDSLVGGNGLCGDTQPERLLRPHYGEP